MKIHKIAFWVLVIGGLNWGLVVLGYDLGRYVSADVARIVYALVGLAAVYEIFTHKKNCKNC